MDYSLSYRDVVDILKILKDAEFCQSLDLEIGELKFSMRRRDVGVDDPTAAGATAAAARSAQRAAQATAAAADDERKPAAASAPAASSNVAGHFVRAPMLGTFYRALEPSAPPCIEVGDIIAAGDTIGLIEVMKLFSPVAAGIAGRVVEVLVENGVLVEHNQPLVRVEPV